MGGCACSSKRGEENYDREMIQAADQQGQRGPRKPREEGRPYSKSLAIGDNSTRTDTDSVSHLQGRVYLKQSRNFKNIEQDSGMRLQNEPFLPGTHTKINITTFLNCTTALCTHTDRLTLAARDPGKPSGLEQE